YQNREGKTTIRKGDNIWRPNKVRNIIASSLYAGVHVYNGRAGEAIERTYPALVSTEQWEQANAQMRRNKALASRNAGRIYLLRGLVRCNTCGVGYAGTPSHGKNGWVGYYYRCNSQLGALLPNKDQRCRAKRIPASWLEDSVWRDVEAFLRTPSDTLDRARRALHVPEPLVDHRGGIVEAEAGLRANEAARERVLELYRRGRIQLSDLEKQLSAVEAEESLLQEKVASLQLEDRKAEAIAEYLDTLEATLRLAGEKLDAINADMASDDTEQVTRATAAKRDLLDLLVERVLVITTGEGKDRDAKIRVHFRFKAAVEMSTARHVCIRDTD
ncbi:MAG TPA: recombinase family protein, partial [Chloroflexota bacterium]|nr:recombinase family protein [Chloroflexota bacterium]